jgi:hypothetical protein
VHDPSRYAGPSTGRVPSGLTIPDWSAVPVKNIGTDHALDSELLAGVPLQIDDVLKVGEQVVGKLAAFLVLLRPGPEVDRVGLPVDLRPLECQDLGGDAPSQLDRRT